jgi:hypothetical protein
MTGPYGAPRRGDPGTKWLVGGTVLSLAMMLGFIAGMSDQLRFPGGSGPGPLLVMVMLGVGAFAAIALGPVGRAVGKRLLEGGQGGDTDAVLRELDDLRLQADDLRNALAETQERLDFTERLIAGSKERLPEELH